MRNRGNYLLFLLGLGSQLQIIASLSMTEAFALAAAPVLFFSEQPYMRRNGIMPLFWLSLAVVLGCIIACWANHTAPTFVLRGMAVACLLPCSIVVGHWALRKNMNGFKWWFLGVLLSGVVCIFVFQKSVELTMLAKGESGMKAANAIISGPIFWISRFSGFVQFPSIGWYLRCPLIYSVFAPIGVAAFSLLTSVSGRSAAICALGSFTLVLIGGKKRQTMRRVGRYFFLWVVLSIGGICIAKTGYQIAATRGWLGEAAREKYEKQTGGNKSLRALLLGGRMESFCGLLACADKPIIGFGPWAIDRYGYVQEFLEKYGKQEDIEKFLEVERGYARAGLIREHLIPCHSIIVEFWVWCGIAGLVFWLYILYIMIRYLKNDCWAVPQWFMWLAAATPSMFWGIFFSPMGERFSPMLFCVAILLVRAVKERRQPLPRDMVSEIVKAEKR